MTSPEPCTASRSRLPSNSRKICPYDLPTMLASTLRRPRCGMPMATSCSPAWAADVSSSSMQRDHRLAALEGEALLADVLGLQEGLERLGGVEPTQDVQLLLGGAGRSWPRSNRAWIQAALLRVLDVHVLDADGPGVRVAQHAEDVAQRHQRLAAEAAGGELAVEVPQRQPVVDEVEVRVASLLGTRAGRCRPSGGRARGRRGSALARARSC